MAVCFYGFFNRGGFKDGEVLLEVRTLPIDYSASREKIGLVGSFAKAFYISLMAANRNSFFLELGRTL